MSENNASFATIKKKAKKRQNEHAKEPTESEVIGVMIPYVAPPSDTEDTVSQIDDTQENFQDNASSSSDYASSDNEAEIEISTSEKKNSWVWPFFSQVKASNGDVITICKVEVDTGVKCNKRYKTKGSTGNLINHLLKHGITKDNPQPQKVYKINNITIFISIINNI
jgi:ATP-dependent protease HslVU (ClpYQ) ATPase subunit